MSLRGLNLIIYESIIYARVRTSSRRALAQPRNFLLQVQCAFRSGWIHTNTQSDICSVGLNKNTLLCASIHLCIFGIVFCYTRVSNVRASRMRAEEKDDSSSVASFVFYCLGLSHVQSNSLWDNLFIESQSRLLNHDTHIKSHYRRADSWWEDEETFETRRKVRSRDARERERLSTV